MIVRSPYPPDALPVDVWGVATTDRVRAQQAAEVPALRAALDGRRLPERRLLAEGVTPPLRSVSYLPAMILAALATILVIGWLVGYPRFRRAAVPERISTWPMVSGDEVLADLYGTDRRAAERIVVDGAPARLALFAPDELERRSWQFALGDAAGPAPIAREDAAAPAILALASGEGPILVRFDAAPSNLRVASGTLVHASRARPAFRLRAAGIDLVAAFASSEERDRALVAILPDRLGAERDGEPPRREVARPAPAAPGRSSRAGADRWVRAGRGRLPSSWPAARSACRTPSAADPRLRPVSRSWRSGPPSRRSHAASSCVGAGRSASGSTLPGLEPPSRPS